MSIFWLQDLTPDKRIGAQGFDTIKSHPFFEGIDWSRLRKLVPPKTARLPKVQFVCELVSWTMQSSLIQIKTFKVQQNVWYRDFWYSHVETHCSPHHWCLSILITCQAISSGDNDESSEQKWETELGQAFRNLDIGGSASESSTSDGSLAASKSASPVNQAKLSYTAGPSSSNSPNGRSPAHSNSNSSHSGRRTAAQSSVVSPSNRSTEESRSFTSGTITDDCRAKQWYIWPLKCFQCFNLLCLWVDCWCGQYIRLVTLQTIYYLMASSTWFNWFTPFQFMSDLSSLFPEQSAM